MNPTATAINAAIQELNATITTLARFPETDQPATSALLTATTARAHLRDALAAAAPDCAPVTPKRKTASHSFFSYNSEKAKLFTVREGIPLGDALAQASCFLASARDVAYSEGGDTYAIGCLVELAKSVVDSINTAEMAGAQ